MQGYGAGWRGTAKEGKEGQEKVVEGVMEREEDNDAMRDADPGIVNKRRRPGEMGEKESEEEEQVSGKSGSTRKEEERRFPWEG